jgi:hypothetical protein
MGVMKGPGKEETMRGKIPKAGVMGMLAIGMLGCSVPAPPQAALEAPNAVQEEIPRITIPDQVSSAEMVKGDDEELETQQRRRRPWIRWRRAFRGGSAYYVPYYYYHWYPRPYYVPYYQGVYWNYYDRPGFRYRSRRFRRDRY